MNARERPRRTPRPGDTSNALHRDLTPTARPNVIVLLWRWRWELALVLGVPAGLAALIARFGWVWTLIGIAAAGAMLVRREARYWLSAGIPLVITAHRGLTPVPRDRNPTPRAQTR